jgi:hypothetical protein
LNKESKEEKATKAKKVSSKQTPITTAAEDKAPASVAKASPAKAA